MIKIFFILILFFNVAGFTQDKYLSDIHPKVIIVKEVYNKISSIYSKLPNPEIKIINKNFNTTVKDAKFYPSDLKIVINETCFDIFYSTDSVNYSALAYLIGHEYAHFYNGDSFEEEFLKIFNNQSDSGDADENNLRIMAERKADFVGSFIAYTAGYDVRMNGPAALEKIYKILNIKNNPLYPSLEQRTLTITDFAFKKLTTLIPVYDLSVILYVTGNYDYSFECLKRIAEEIPCKEIFNNMAVCNILSAINFRDSSEVFVYPVEFDFNSHFFDAGTRGNENKTIFNQKLNSAEIFLNKTRELDKNYYSAIINFLIVHLLKGNLKEAQRLLEDINDENNNFSNFSDKHFYYNYLVLSGIYNYKKKDFQIANDYFSKASELNTGYGCAEVNLKMLQDNLNNKNKKSELNTDDLLIDGLSPYQFSDFPTGEKLERFYDLDIKYDYNDKIKAVLLKTSSNMRSFSFISTVYSYTGKFSNKISLNDSKEKLISIYNQPSVFYKSNDIENYLYWCKDGLKSSGIIFTIKNNIITKWTVFSVSYRN